MTELIKQPDDWNTPKPLTARQSRAISKWHMAYALRCLGMTYQQIGIAVGREEGRRLSINSVFQRFNNYMSLYSPLRPPHTPTLSELLRTLAKHPDKEYADARLLELAELLSP